MSNVALARFLTAFIALAMRLTIFAISGNNDEADKCLKEMGKFEEMLDKMEQRQERDAVSAADWFRQAEEGEPDGRA